MNTSNKNILVLAPASNRFLDHLNTVDVNTTLCNSFDDLVDLTSNQISIDTFDAVVLMSDPEENCKTAGYIAKYHPYAFMVALTRNYVNGELIALYLTGVSFILRPDDPEIQLYSLLQAYWLKNTHLEFVDRPADQLSYSFGDWSLEDLAWVLCHKNGSRLSLSVSERALVLKLFNSPGGICAVETLEAELDAAWKTTGKGYDKQPSVCSIFNRLRKKADQQGVLRPPVSSIRNYGYVWSI